MITIDHLTKRYRNITELDINRARCPALFCSGLQPSDAPTADMVAAAISRAVQQFGVGGCAARAQPAGLSPGGYEAGYVPATMPAGTVAGHAGWQPACTRTEVGPEHRLPHPDTGGTR